MSILPPGFDRRITPARSDLAAKHLEGIVQAGRYEAASAYRVTATCTPMRRLPDSSGPYDTELLYGEWLDIYDLGDEWAWGQARRDGYVGYVPMTALSRDGSEPSHRAIALRSFCYPEATIKATPLGFLPYGAELRVWEYVDTFARTEAGFVFAGHLAALDQPATDPVAEARRFLGIPYLWGGKTSLGLDCSGLVQTVHRACGINAPRDSDMQERELGIPVAIPERPDAFLRGDLLFWPGHVAIAEGAGVMIHATAHSMSVISEPIGPAIERIAAQGYPLRSVRRLTKP